MDWDIANTLSVLSRSSMKISYLMLFLSSLCVTILVLNRSLHLSAPSKADYDHSMLALDWPNGYCSTQNCSYSPLPQEFGIHGIWPVDKDGQDILNCNRTPIIDIFKEDPQLQDKVLANWPGLSVTREDIPGQRCFWNRQWTKHGSCQTVMTPEQYFYKGLELSNRVDLLNALAARRMWPGGSYTKKQYTEAIQAKIGRNLTVVFRCKPKDSVQLLLEVFVCVDHSARNFIGCDKERRKDSCKNNDPIKLAERVELLQEAARYEKTEL